MWSKNLALCTLCLAIRQLHSLVASNFWPEMHAREQWPAFNQRLQFYSKELESLQLFVLLKQLFGKNLLKITSKVLEQTKIHFFGRLSLRRIRKKRRISELFPQKKSSSLFHDEAKRETVRINRRLFLSSVYK